MADPNEELRAALGSLRAGRAAEAEARLRALLQADPTQARARPLLGIVLLELGKPLAALAELDAAAGLLPPSPELHYNRGNALAALNRHAEAARAYAQAVALRPGFAEAHFNAGNMLDALGRKDAALAEYQRAAALAPTLAPAHARTGLLLVEAGRDAEAIAPLQRALELQPALPEARNALGVALHRTGRVQEALACYESALAARPNDADAWNNRGNAMHDLLRTAEALACYERALQLQPAHPGATANRGMALQDLRRFDEAAQAYERAIALRPGHAEAYRRRASLRLLLGDFERGWADFERAHELALAGEAPGLPWWRGESLAGRSILLSEPNGIGDLLQFLRFVPRLLEAGARVSLAIPARFRRLLAGLDPRIALVDEHAASGHDFRCWLWSLPHWLRIGGDVADPRAPLLRAEAALVAKWAAQLDAGCINVGIAWQGNPTRKIDRGRSIPLADFAPLARVPGVRLVSLQKHFGVEQLDALPDGMRVQVPGPGFDEGEDAFVDTAALLQSLDLVVCADTSLTHLAGALGRPAWPVLNPVPDWRWQLDRADSPWYPQARLFRQEPGGGWAAAIGQVARALEDAAPALRAARTR